MNQRLFMIQGVFFFAHLGEMLQYYHFAGIIHPSEEDEDTLAGQLTDTFGDSFLTNVFMGDQEVTFTKQYVHRNDTIDYYLNKSTDLPNLWVGEYVGIATGRNRVNCLITEVPVDFLTPTHYHLHRDRS